MGASNPASALALSIRMAKSGRKTPITWFPRIFAPREAAPAWALAWVTRPILFFWMDSTRAAALFAKGAWVWRRSLSSATAGVARSKRANKERIKRMGLLLQDKTVQDSAE